MKKYRIIYKSPDAYSGWNFFEDDGGAWETIDDAVKTVLASWIAGYEFKVILVVEWTAKA